MDTNTAIVALVSRLHTCTDCAGTSVERRPSAKGVGAASSDIREGASKELRPPAS